MSIGRKRESALIATAIVGALACVGIVDGCGSSRAAFDAPDTGPPPPPSLGTPPDASCGLACRVPTCSGGATTTISGVVLDPAGQSPIYDAIVYVPLKPVDPFPQGVSCDRCGVVASGDPLVSTLTDVRGEFHLTGVPAGADVPLVIQVGKWRRQITLPNVDACKDNPIADRELTRLPRKKSEGDIPLIAVTTGCDPMECLLRRIGIDDSEFTTPSHNGRIHLYKAEQGEGVIGSPYAETLWDDVDALKKYDIVLMSCECDAYPTNKSEQARQNMSAYASAGGRVFGNHYHSYWFREGPADFKSSATWAADPTGTTNTEVFDVDTSFPKGKAFDDWLANADASAGPGKIDLNYVGASVGDVNPAVSQRWIYETLDGGAISAKYMTFNTPVGKPPEEQCGRVVFTDLHLGTGEGGKYFPDGCETKPLSPQEKALEFLLFDLSACVQDDKQAPKPPR